MVLSCSMRRAEFTARPGLRFIAFLTSCLNRDGGVVAPAAVSGAGARGSGRSARGAGRGMAAGAAIGDGLCNLAYRFRSAISEPGVKLNQRGTGADLVTTASCPLVVPPTPMMGTSPASALAALLHDRRGQEHRSAGQTACFVGIRQTGNRSARAWYWWR